MAAAGAEAAEAVLLAGVQAIVQAIARVTTTTITTTDPEAQTRP